MKPTVRGSSGVGGEWLCSAVEGLSQTRRGERDPGAEGGGHTAGTRDELSYWARAQCAVGEDSGGRPQQWARRVVQEAGLTVGAASSSMRPQVEARFSSRSEITPARIPPATDSVSGAGVWA
jgi:hypothetical protein